MLNIKDLSSPELPVQDNYEQALKIALEAFGRKDPGRVADKAAAEFVNRCVIVPYLDSKIVLDVDDAPVFVHGERPGSAYLVGHTYHALP